MDAVTVNMEQRLYVIAAAGGFSCLGFDNARNHANQITGQLGWPELAFAADDAGSTAGYEKYQRAVHAWGRSPLCQETYFDPGTDPAAAMALESCRETQRKVRLVLGDTVTGQSWFDDFDVVGRIGRSTGWLKVPLLVEDGEAGGCAILTACLLCVIDWQTGKTRYRHAAYQVPDLRLESTDASGHPWAVWHQEKELARFSDIGKASAYLAFMRGETIEPRVFR